MLSPIASSKSNTTFEPALRQAMPITSLTCTSRQARTHRLHWMQASRLTRIAGWLGSCAQRSAAGNRLAVTAVLPAHRQKELVGSCEVACAGWSATSSSMTILRAVVAREVWLCTFMPTAGMRLQDGASTRSPSISTMQTRQLPSGR